MPQHIRVIMNLNYSSKQIAKQVIFYSILPWPTFQLSELQWSNGGNLKGRVTEFSNLKEETEKWKTAVPIFFFFFLLIYRLIIVGRVILVNINNFKWLVASCGLYVCDISLGNICLLVEGDKRNGSVGTWRDGKGKWTGWYLLSQPSWTVNFSFHISICFKESRVSARQKSSSWKREAYQMD